MNRALGIVLAILTVAAAIAFYVSSADRPALPDVPSAAQPVTAHTADGAAAPAPTPAPRPSASAPATPVPTPAPPVPTPVPSVPASSPAGPAEPAGPAPTQLYLTAPGLTDPGATEVFTATWIDGDGYGVDGVVLLQRAEGAGWVTVAELTTSTGRASTGVTVAASAIYRLLYPGSDELAPQVSAEVAVIAATRLESALTVSAPATPVVAGGAVTLTIGWHNAAGVPIIGDVQLQALAGDSWTVVSTLATSADGTATATVTPSAPTTYRAVYPGGTRYLPVTSADLTVTAVEAATIPVRSCAGQADVDALPHGVGCHYTSVAAGVFVVGHDFLGNAWWNELPLQSYVQLTGEQAGLYEVVDRVIAPGRASELGPAEQWTCGDRCDVILQTCLGENTGFTWLRRVAG
ncbi:Ig-like domain-containing protein [Jiangella anatolica]|uniref:Ig-like domain-containing protein n=1 Tax=Jiangella anatolica TaxID=2670374 RepID=UPI0011B77DB7|nr:Ig-like domain-containing protein [Jiangella anatolica]